MTLVFRYVAVFQNHRLTVTGNWVENGRQISHFLTPGIMSVCLPIRPSVLPSHSGVLSRPAKIRSCGFQHQVGQSQLLER